MNKTNTTQADNTKNDAVYQAGKMLLMPHKDLPAPARHYLKYLSDRVGMCIEVCLTAYAHYNQAVLNMPCDDALYKINHEAKEWFKQNNYCQLLPTSNK